jgi:hypothetical protein
MPSCPCHSGAGCKAFTLDMWKNRSLYPTRAPRVQRYVL